MPGQRVAARSHRAGRRADLWPLLVLFLGTAVSLGLRWLVPFNISAIGAGYYDQALFLRQTLAFHDGDWLGVFDKVTLSKGPSYSVFNAALGWVRISPPMGAHLTYLAAAGVLALAVFQLTAQRWAAVWVYVFVALDPVNFTPVHSQLYRDNWYSGLSLLVLGSFFLAVLGALRRQSLPVVVLWTLVSGFSAAAFWLCREEGAWLVPAMLTVALGLPTVELLRRRRNAPRASGGHGRKGASRTAVVFAMVLVVFALCAWAPVAYVADRNQEVYGARLTNDSGEGQFARAYGAWSRIRGVPLTPEVPINAAQRRAGYAVSESARELQPWLEDPANPWYAFACEQQRCTDFPNGAEIWAFRDAAESAGHFRSEPEFQDYFARVADELELACDEQRIECAPDLPPSLQPFLRTRPEAVARLSLRWTWLLWAEDRFYDPFASGELFPVPDADRAVIGEAMAGVPDTEADARSGTARFDRWRWGYEALGVGYRIALAALVLVAVTGLATAVARRARRRKSLTDPAMVVLMLALGVAAAVRIVVFAVVELAEGFGVDARYHLPTRLMAVALLAVGAATGLAQIRTWRRPATEDGGQQPLQSPGVTSHP